MVSVSSHLNVRVHGHDQVKAIYDTHTEKALLSHDVITKVRQRLHAKMRQSFPLRMSSISQDIFRVSQDETMSLLTPGTSRQNSLSSSHSDI